MKKTFRPGVFVVTYRINPKSLKNSLKKDQIEYLILHRHKHWKGYEFPKGGIEPGETLLQTVKREIKEETGLKIIKLKNWKIHGRYRYPKILKDRPLLQGQTYTLFSAQVNNGKIRLDCTEHSGYVWLPFEKAVKKLTWSNQKKCLKIVHQSLSLTES